MANTVIQLKYSSTPSSMPSSLANGELAINYADGKLYYKNTTGQIVSFSSAAVANVLSFATVNANGSLITATATNSILTISNGDNIEITGDIINDIITISANLKPAFDRANSKTYTFYQNTKPSTSNSHDLWVHSDTGVVYENFGTTSTPIWAEFGPSTAVANLTPGVVSTTNLVFSDASYQTTAGATVVNAVAAFSHSNTTYAAVNSAFGVINTAFNVANNAYTSTNGVAAFSHSNTTYAAVNSAFGVANAAFGKANTALQNTTGTLAGALTITGNTTVNGIAPNYAPNRPAFRVIGGGTTNNLTTTQNGTGCLTSNNWTVSYNQGGYLANTNGIFTAPVTGLYQVNVIGRNSGYSSGISQIGVTKNGSSGGTVGGECILMIEWAASSTMNHAGGSTIINLNAGDTLACKILAGQINFDGNDNWSVAYIG